MWVVYFEIFFSWRIERKSFKSFYLHLVNKKFFLYSKFGILLYQKGKLEMTKTQNRFENGLAYTGLGVDF